MHVPKTSGTTSYNRFMILLQEKLNVTVTPPTHKVNKDGVKQLANRGHVMEQPCQKKYQKMKGSYTPGVHCAASEIADCVENIAYPNHKTKFLTVLRHPVDRVISEYYWWLHKPMQWTESMNSVKYDGIDAWVKDPTNIAHNRQAMYFLLDTEYPTHQELSPHDLIWGARHCIPNVGPKALEWIRSKYGSVEKFNNISVSDGDEIDFWGLDRFAFIGIMEDMTTSEKKLREVFGIEEEGEEESTKKVLGKRNHANYKKEDISLETRKLIEERNRLDMILYEKIKKNLYGTTTSRE